MFDYLPNKKFLLTGVFPKMTKMDEVFFEMEELKLLVETYGGEVKAAIIQKADHPHFSTYLGSGKAQSVADTIIREKIDIVVAKDALKAGQIYTLENIFS